MIFRSLNPPGRRPIAALAAAAALAVTGWAAPARAVDYSDYHTFAEVEAQLTEWGRGDLVSIESIGKSAGGKDLWVATVAAPGPTRPDQRPAVFVGANIAGFHNAGTEAALDLIETLVERMGGEEAATLAGRTFYIAPALNPDAHDGLFAPVRRKVAGNAMVLDRDRDGFEAEDGFEDLNGDGRITRMRIADPAGLWLPHPEDSRVMIQADPMERRAGAYRVLTEGRDDDGDGEYGEDPKEGIHPDRNFPHAFPYAEAEAGPWPSYAPETRAVMDFLLAHRNVAAAVVYGPANNFLAAPQSLGGGGDLGTAKFTIPEDVAGFIGLEPEVEYTLDEVWDHIKDMPFIKAQNVTKQQVAQFLGAGPATQVEDGDQAVLTHLAKAYKKRLEDAGLDVERPGEQYAKGGLTPWLYYQYNVLAVELDVWGVPKPPKPEADEEAAADAPLTLSRMEGMSSEELVALGAEKIDAFLREIGAPPQFTGEMVIERVEGGQVTPEQLAQMARQMGAEDGGGDGGGEGGEGAEDDAATKRARAVLAWVDANAPEASTAWTEVTLPDGTRAEVGGLDPFIQIAPPRSVLEPALAVHTETVLDLAEQLAEVEIVSTDVEALGGGVYRVKATAGNRGFLPTHTRMAVRATSLLPVRMVLETGSGVSRVTGRAAMAEQRLDGTSGRLTGEWLVHAENGGTVTVRLRSANAGSAEATVNLPRGGAR